MIYINNLELMRADKVLLEETSATIYPNTRVGLIGRNGCGKSTFFALLKGELQPENGDVIIPKDWIISSVSQETLGLDTSALNYVIDGDKNFRNLEIRLQNAIEKNDGILQAKIHEEMENANAYTIKSRAESLLLGLGFSKDDFHKPTKDFSGGWRMRLNLAQALLCPSNLLLLDEPTNHLDLDTVMWLEDYLKAYKGTLIIISHDRDFLDNITDHIIHIEGKKLHAYTGNYSQFEIERARKLELEKSMYEKQQKQLAHMQSFVDRFRYKATKAKQAQSRLKAMEKMEKIVLAQVDSPFTFKFFESDELPSPLISMENLSAGYKDKTVLNDIKFNLVPGSRIGLLGRNGAGKSTFIKTLAGIIPPLSGSVSISKNIKVGYFAQHQLESLDINGTPLSELQKIAQNEKELTLRSFLGGFGFSSDKALSTIKTFSGGEKARLALALIVWQKPNLLLLDEPTNHLDLMMREAIVIALSDFKGALVVVSHDRHLLTTTTNEFYLVSEGKVNAFDGDLDDYHNYLIELDKAKEQVQNKLNKDELAAKSSIKTKEQKRIEANFRESLRPLKKEITTLEEKLEKLNTRKEELENILANNELYEEQNKEKLKQILLEQNQVNESLEEVELKWLTLNEEIETKTKEFIEKNNINN
jgi:ATP-binding cassette subfamily F protein 3